MTSKREYIDYINDILDSIEKIELFTHDMNFEEFKNDDKTSYAVIRCFEIIGEATKNLPDRLIKNYKNVPWKEMAGIRDKLIHGYFGVNLKVIWKTIQKDIKKLKPLIISIREGINK
ncbi:MAG: DUF86 domain-containing protein [Promethearchaeia archaeon]